MNPPKQRVLFVCIGNACRSQMAEGFARTYGSDVLEPYSAGLAPAFDIPPITRAVMREKGIDLGEQFPKPLWGADPSRFELVLNMSGTRLDGPNVRAWEVADPMGQSDAVHRAVRDQIEGLVMQLILDARRAPLASPAPAPGSPPRNRPKLLRG